MYPFAVSGIIILLSAACLSKRSWSYELISIFTNTTDKSILEFDVKAHRISRGVIGISGVWNWNFDVDNTTMVEMFVYSSFNGIESEYKLLPYQVPKMTWDEYLNKFYNQMFYENAKHCSTLPYFKNLAETPWKRGIYKFDRCVPEVNGTPDVVPDSFYRIWFKFSGQVDVYFAFTVKVAMKFF